MGLPKIKDYEAVRVHYGKGFEIGLYKKEDEYIMYRHAARGKVKNFVKNYEYIDNNDISHLKPITLQKGNEILDRVEKGMKYKHEVAIQSSKYYKDSLPAKDWYEEKWLNWTPETTDLEISEKHRHLIKKAIPWVFQK